MSPSLQTMGFFMSDINFCNTKEQLNHLGEVVTGKVDGSPTGADIDTSTLPYTGQVRKTLPALEAEYLEAIRNAGGIPLNGGVWAGGQTFTTYNQFMVYNGIAYKPLTPTALPYGPTGATPDTGFVGPFSELSQQNLGGLTNYQSDSVSDMILGKTIGLSGVITHTIDQVWNVGSKSYRPNTIPVVDASSFSDVEFDAIEYDLFVIYGQSNAVGFAGGSDGRRTIPANSKFWYNRNGAAEWRDLVYDMPYIEGGGPTTTSTGHAWVEFAREYRKQTGRGCLFVPAAYGGLPISDLDVGTPRWSGMIAATQAALSNNDYVIKNTSMLWCQGESDMTDGTTQGTYVNTFTAMMADFLVSFPGASCYMSRTGDPRTRPEAKRTAIHAAQDRLCKINQMIQMAFDGASSFTIKGGMISSDETHYTQKGYNLMGSVMAKAAALNIGSEAAITGQSEISSRQSSGLILPSEQIHYATIATLKHDGSNWNLSSYDDGGRRRLHNISAMTVGSSIVLDTSSTTQDICTMLCQVNKQGQSFGLKSTIRDGSTEGKIVIELFADTQAVIDTASGSISYPPLGSSQNTGFLSDLSVDISSGFPKLSYSSHNNVPIVSAVTGGGLSEFIPIAQTAQSSSNIWFKYQSTPTETRALVNFKDKPVSAEDIRLNGLTIDVFAMIGDRDD